MAEFVIQNYWVMHTTVEAESAEEALQLWYKLPIEGDLSCPSALRFDYSMSECMGEVVEDANGNCLIETY